MYDTRCGEEGVSPRSFAPAVLSPPSSRGFFVVKSAPKTTERKPGLLLREEWPWSTMHGRTGAFFPQIRILRNIPGSLDLFTMVTVKHLPPDHVLQLQL